MNGQNAVGSPVARKEEDLRLITGHGTCVSNLQLPRMRHVAFGRSPLAHARIRSVDATAARQVPGVRAVFTGTGCRSRRAACGSSCHDQPAP